MIYMWLDGVLMSDIEVKKSLLSFKKERRKRRKIYDKYYMLKMNEVHVFQKKKHQIILYDSPITEFIGFILVLKVIKFWS
jgi:hypothetical protein